MDNDSWVNNFGADRHDTALDRQKDMLLTAPSVSAGPLAEDPASSLGILHHRFPCRRPCEDGEISLLVAACYSVKSIF
jgi:hypothetical protein